MLVVLEPSLTVGLTLGCLISNIFSTVSALDIVIGTAGTLLGCLLAARVKRDWLVPVPVILANAVLVGAMLAYVLTPDALVQGFFINGGEVLLGEAVVLYLLGVPLLLFFRRSGLMEKLLHGAHPVSYTHLDVYKRQRKKPPRDCILCHSFCTSMAS